jgi:hypothetical protein
LLFTFKRELQSFLVAGAKACLAASLSENKQHYQLNMACLFYWLTKKLRIPLLRLSMPLLLFQIIKAWTTLKEDYILKPDQ